jgi:hypothetical protein
VWTGFAIGFSKGRQFVRIEVRRNAPDWRDYSMQHLPASRPALEPAAEIEKLCRDLHAQAQHPED